MELYAFCSNFTLLAEFSGKARLTLTRESKCILFARLIQIHTSSAVHAQERAIFASQRRFKKISDLSLIYFILT